MHGVLELKDILYTTLSPTDLYFVIRENKLFIVYEHRYPAYEVWVKIDEKINIVGDLDFRKGVIPAYKVNLV